jgi:uncharacterized protein (DUF1684 family)
MILPILSLLCLVNGTFSQSEFENDIEVFQSNLNKQYSDSSSSPLLRDDFMNFTGLEFFPPNKKFRIEAKFIRKFDPITVTLKTTTNRAPLYKLYAEVHFTLDGNPVKLNVYKSIKQKEEDEDYMFLPFTDLTNGISTYEGGRYIDLEMTQGDTITIDFNQSYNPYCAYNHKYSCVVPPSENWISTKIEAGVKKFSKKE